MPTAASPGDLAHSRCSINVGRMSENDHMLTFPPQARDGLWAIFIFFFMLIFPNFLLHAPIL